MKKLLASLIMIGFFSLLLAPAAHAEDKVQITLSPISENVELEPGKTYTKSITVYNSGAVPYKFMVYSRPYTVSNISYTPVFGKETDRTQVFRWVKFATDSYELAPGKTVEIPYSIVVPSSIPDGGQYAAIFAETVGEANNDVLTKKRVGAILYTQAKGTNRSAGSSEFDSPSLIQSSSSVDTTTRITNSGNVDFSSTVSQTVTGYFSKKVFSKTTLTKPVLPDTTRALLLNYESPGLLSLYRITRTATYLNKSHTSTVTVLVVSPVFTAAALLTLLTLSAVLIWIKSHVKRSTKEKRPLVHGRTIKK